MPNWIAVFLFFVMILAGILQYVTLTCVKSNDLATSGKKIMIAAFAISAIRCINELFGYWDLTHWSINVLIIFLVALGSMAMNLDRIIGNMHKRRDSNETFTTT